MTNIGRNNLISIWSSQVHVVLDQRRDLLPLVLVPPGLVMTVTPPEQTHLADINSRGLEYHST